MINPELKLYYDQVFQFCKSIIVKSDLMAIQMKNTTLKVAGVEITNDYENPYYINLIGEYSFLDEPIYITENGERVVLNKTLLTNKPWLKKKYHVYGKAFEKLITEYPNRESFIRCILCQPFITLEEAINAPDLSLVYYDDTILDYQERTSLIEALKSFITMFKKRWAINDFAYEELYGLSLLSIFYSQLPLYMLTQRVKNIKTRFAHTMHIWDYLSSYGLSDYRSVLTIDQQLFLYRNIDYIVKNLGKHGTLAILIEKLLNQNYLTIAPKMVINDYSYDKSETLNIKPSVVSRQFDQTPISQFFENDSISTEQFLYILFVNGFISKYEYEKYNEAEEKLSLISNTSLQTKFLELKRNFPSSPIQNFLLNMLVAGIFHFIYKNQLTYTVPIYVDEFDYSELLTPKLALLVVLYCLQKENYVEDPKVPAGVKIYPFPCDYDLLDLNIPGTEKKISDYINISEFIKRYSELFEFKMYNFNNEPIIDIVDGSKLILKDLLLSTDNNVELNIALSLLHKQMFTYKESFIENNEVPIFDMPGMSIKEWLRINHRTLYDVFNKIEIGTNVTYTPIIEQLMEELFPSSIINDAELNIFIPDSYKYDKLKQLFIQLCSYNVVFLDNNVENQITHTHAPLLMNNTIMKQLIGLTDLSVLSYDPLPYEEKEDDPLFTGLLKMNAKLNDDYDRLIDCKLELCENPYFVTHVITITNVENYFLKEVGIKPNNIKPGLNYYARVSYRSKIFDFEFIGPSESYVFNSGRIKQPRLNLPKLIDAADLVKIRKPQLYIDENYVEGTIVSDQFMLDLSNTNLVIKKDKVKTPTLFIYDETLTGAIRSSAFEIITDIDEDGKIIQLNSTPMKLTYNHEDKHIQSRWVIARDQKLKDIVMDTDWVPDLNSIIFTLKTHDVDQYYFGVRYKGKRFGESSYSNVTSFALSEIKQPSIENVFGVYEPANKSIFKISSDPFEVLGAGTDTHVSSKWIIAADSDMQKVIFDSGWLTTNLTSYNTDYLIIDQIEVFDIKEPQLKMISSYINSNNIESSEFKYSSYVDYVKPERVYLFVQYKGQTLGESLFSEPFIVESSEALRGDLKVIITESIEGEVL